MATKSIQTATAETPDAKKPEVATDNAKLEAHPRQYEPRSDKELTDFISESELRRRLPVSRRTIHNWRRAGKIPSIVIGRRVLFCWENVVDALRRLESGGEQ